MLLWPQNMPDRLLHLLHCFRRFADELFTKPLPILRGRIRSFGQLPCERLAFQLVGHDSLRPFGLCGCGHDSIPSRVSVYGYAPVFVNKESKSIAAIAIAFAIPNAAWTSIRLFSAVKRSTRSDVATRTPIGLVPLSPTGPIGMLANDTYVLDHNLAPAYPPRSQGS